MKMSWIIISSPTGLKGSGPEKVVGPALQFQSFEFRRFQGRRSRAAQRSSDLLLDEKSSRSTSETQQVCPREGCRMTYQEA